jgi:hypothetical protein
MAKVKGPLFSVSATGIFHDLLEYRTGGGKTTVHGRREPPASRSSAQLAQSSRFADAVGGWRSLGPAQKAAWQAAAAGTGHTGYQLYLSEYQTQAVHPPGQPTPP